MDVASLLRLNIRRRGGSRVVYADCPICGDRRGKMGLYLNINTWRCWHCGESGGMLPLYGRVHGISNSEAYREICDALAIDGFAAEGSAPVCPVKEPSPRDVPPDKAPDEEIHRTLTALLSLLTLTPAHREHLRTVRGLTDNDIDSFGFKSTPTSRLCRTLTQRLINQGCRVQGVPGFYVNDYGKWTVKCVAEYIQTMCIEDPAFARKTMHPRKTMIRCFQYISRKAWAYIQDELKANGIQPGPGQQGYGSDIPDDLCFQWAVDYFNDPDAKEDHEDEEEFVPKPYIGGGTSKSKGSKTAKGKTGDKKADTSKKAAAKEPSKKPAEDDSQLSLLGVA